MTIYLVRHAHAGSRDRWRDDDIARPLSDRGLAQSEALADRLAEVAPAALWSSPFVRCRQTLQPLAERTGLPINDSDALAEGASTEAALAFVDDLGPHSVCCTHGDVIPDVVAALQRRGMDIPDDPDWRKATVWVLERSEQRFTDASVWAPPGR